MPKRKRDSSSRKGKNDFRIVRPEEAQPDTTPAAQKTGARNFWNSCPLQLEYHPKEPCGLGERSSKAKKDSHIECPWFINSKEHNYCFWQWLKANSLPNGQMRPLLQNEIAKLLGCSPTKVHFLEKEAKRKLKESGQLGGLVQLLSGNEAEADNEDLNELVNQIDERSPVDDE